MCTLAPNMPQAVDIAGASLGLPSRLCSLRHPTKPRARGGGGGSRQSLINYSDIEVPSFMPLSKYVLVSFVVLCILPICAPHPRLLSAQLQYYCWIAYV